MAAASPQALPLPPQAPAVPDGWRADWSTEYQTWYYVNLSTQISQWHNPLGQSPQPQQYPPSEQQYAPTQQYPGSEQQTPQYDSNGNLQDAPGPDGERGLGTVVGGGLIGIAGGLIAGHFLTHKKSDTNNKFSFFGNSAAAGATGGGMFQGIATHIPFGNNSTNYAPAPAAYTPAPAAGGGGGMFQGITSHMPFSNIGVPQLHIHCAAYCDQDVTQAVRRMISPDQSLQIDTTKVLSIFGDPWPGNRKQLSVLYSYGDRPWELLASAEDNGMLSIIPHQPLDKGRMEFVQPPPSRVVAVVWGFENGLQQGKGRVVKMQEIETSGEFEASNSWMGFDGMCGPAKTSIAYYRLHNGTIAIATAREGGTCRLPWNPLAKWT